MSLRIAGIASSIVALVCSLFLIIAAVVGLALMAQTSQEVSVLGVDFYVQTVGGHGLIVALLAVGIAASVFAAGAAAIACISLFE